MEWKFLVKGSAPQPYEARFRIEGASLKAVCTCPNGANGYCCKHLLNLLTTDTAAPIFKLFDPEMQYRLRDFLKAVPQTQTYAALQEFLTARKQADAARVEENRTREQLEQLIISRP